MSLFKSYRKFKTVERFGDNGHPIRETVEVPRWSTAAAISFLKSKGGELLQFAVRDGWHINLIDFVQHQHRLPSAVECENLVLDFQKIEAATQISPKRPTILERRRVIAAELSEPLQLNAAE